MQKTLICTVAGGALLFARASLTANSKTLVPLKPTGAQHFETKVAPILSQQCLGCHGEASKKGGLDLSRKASALAGGKSGKAIVPGKANQSLLWKHVQSDEMPPAKPLTAAQKKILQEWIDAGATWAGEKLNPLAHVRDRRANSPWVQRLTVPEYIETVRSTLGVDVAQDARRLLPTDLRADGFSNTAYNLTAGLEHIEAYAQLAEIIVSRLDVKAFVANYTKSQEPSEANMRKLISGMGKWLLRGPLEESEITAFLRVSNAVQKEGGGFPEAARYIIEAMLQSPRFIYRIEKQVGDGKARRVGGYELASRLSYILWGAPPDRELMRAAEVGELSDQARTAAQVQRMLKDPRAVERSLQFIQDWLNLDRLKNLRPNSQRFPQWNQQLASDMREETLTFFKHVAWERKRPLSELMNAKVTFVTPRLAEHYGLRPVGGADSLPPIRKDGLQVLYTFEDGSGDTIRDRSGHAEPLDLKIADASAVKWGKGGLTVHTSTLIATATAPKRLIDAIKKSKAVTLEVWVTPADKNQSGPARILTLSSGASQRNFTLGQDGDKFDVRFREGHSDANGMPSTGTAGGSAQTRQTQVLYTRDTDGKARLYVNGEEKGSHDGGGDLSTWDNGFLLALANETTKDRAWRGTFHRVAIYNRVLKPEVIAPKDERMTREGMARYDLSSVPSRGGLLTQGSVLTIGGDNASMVARGLFVLHDLLYSAVGSPPPGTDTTPVPPKPGRSHRVVAQTRLANSSCGGCHAKFEPLAFGLEKFDGIGAWHEKDEHGNKLREDGAIQFPGQAKPVAYQSTAELMNLLAASPRVRKNITRKVTQFALGRPLAESDAPIIDKIHTEAQKSGGTYASLASAIAMSDLVRMTHTEIKQ